MNSNINININRNLNNNTNMESNINVPHNNNNLWELVSCGLIDENDVFENGKIINQGYINYLMSLNITTDSNRNFSTSSNSNIRQSITPRSNNIRRNRSISQNNRNNIFIPNIQDTSRALRRNHSMQSNNNRSLNQNNQNNTNSSNGLSLRQIQIERNRQLEREKEIERRERELREMYRNNEFENDYTNKINLNSSSPLLCVICLTNERKYIITPCNHFCLCDNCSERVQYENKCPICRTSNISVQEIYY